MIRIANPENVFPQRLFKRIHKMQERAEKSHSRLKKENGDATAGQSGTVPPPPIGFPGRGRGMYRGRGMHGFGGMRGMGETGGMGGMRGGMGGMCGRGGMGGMSGGYGVGAWAGPAFDAMMRGWMGEQTMGHQGNKTEGNANTNHASEHQQAHEAASGAAKQVHEQAHNAANEASASAAQDEQNDAFEQMVAMTGSAEYLQEVGNFVAAALDPLGIDVQVDIETPEGNRNTVRSSAQSTSASSSSSSSSNGEDKTEQKDDETKKGNSTTISQDEEWTVVAEEKKRTKNY
eukprot:GFUD01091485.1.p1 GENE.GFUD01091485.1~~GFUD01091485.1.p1  ORF type:complete len:314 (+),score=104.10 GFUD01091485.1:78-944(+)